MAISRNAILDVRPDRDLRPASSLRPSHPNRFAVVVEQTISVMITTIEALSNNYARLAGAAAQAENRALPRKAGALCGFFSDRGLRRARRTWQLPTLGVRVTPSETMSEALRPGAIQAHISRDEAEADDPVWNAEVGAIVSRRLSARPSRRRG
jgi:hypothetical protein